MPDMALPGANMAQAMDYWNEMGRQQMYNQARADPGYASGMLQTMVTENAARQRAGLSPRYSGDQYNTMGQIVKEQQDYQARQRQQQNQPQFQQPQQPQQPQQGYGQPQQQSAISSYLGQYSGQPNYFSGRSRAVAPQFRYGRPHPGGIPQSALSQQLN